MTLQHAGPRRNRASTHPGHGDHALRGRTYAIPFDAVWRAAVRLASGGMKRWVLLDADDGPGRIRAEVNPLIWGRATEVQIRIKLDADGQTRVDLIAATPGQRWDFNRARRKTLLFFRMMDQELDADASRILIPRRPGANGAGAVAALALGLIVGACAETPPAPGTSDAETEAAADSTAAVALRAYERSVVFLSTQADTVFIVPWILESTTRPGGVWRHNRAWLGRNGEWDRFLEQVWTTEPAREPWQILPREGMRILMGEGNRLDRIFYRDGGRSIEVSLGEALAEWTGNRGGSFNVLRGEMVLGDRQVSGQVLDVSQGIRLQEGVMGDWMVLVSGDSMSLVVQAPLYREEGVEYEGWSRDRSRVAEWPEVEVEWTASRSFEPARRDIPSVLEIRSVDRELQGELTVLDLELETRPAEGPILPVDGIMEVEGVVLIGERRFPVRGILRHRQP